VYLVGLKNTGRNSSGEGKQLEDKGLFDCLCICVFVYLPARRSPGAGGFICRIIEIFLNPPSAGRLVLELVLALALVLGLIV
jgi:hypothetical protein